MRNIDQISQEEANTVIDLALECQIYAAKKFGRATPPYFRFCYDGFAKIGLELNVDDELVAELILFPGPIAEAKFKHEIN